MPLREFLSLGWKSSFPTPLSLVFVVGKVLRKLVDVPLLGKRLPVQTGVAPPVHPASFILTALGVSPAFCTEVIASTMLLLGSPTDWVAGTAIPPTNPIKERKPSYPPKKKSLSFLIGPPTTAPNCSNCAGVSAQDPLTTIAQPEMGLATLK